MKSEDTQYSFWGIGNGNDDPWDVLHAHFEKEARRDGGIVEESTTTGTAAPAKEGNRD